MRTDRETLFRLEWDRVLEMIAASVRTPMGHEQVDEVVPLPDDEAVRHGQARAAEMRAAHARIGRLPVTDVEHPRPVLAALQVAGKVLDGRDIYETVRMLSVARLTARALETLDTADFPELARAAAFFPELSGVIDSIEGNLTPTGGVEDHASPELTRIRREIRHLKESVTRILEDLLRAEGMGPVLRDRYITSRNDRFVVPVRTDTPRRLPGIVHGTSDSQKTLFVEPMETVEINNQLVRLRDEEEQEVDRILTGYTEMLRASLDEIARTAVQLGAIDLLEAIALWAEAHRCVRPDLEAGTGLRIVRGRHPVLERTLAAQDPPRQVVPLDVDVDEGVRVLVISGPNAGGKTVALKTVGLLAAMAHAGLPVPADEARMPFFGRIMADIGDEQSILGSLSTFASHVKNLAGMIRDATPPALALVDEIGTGTDPGEGAALGIAVLDRLRRAGVHVVATTHHAALKAWAYREPGVLNAACDFDDRSLRPTYRVVSGVAGASIGLTMARQLGLDDDVVSDAERRLDPSGAEATQLLDSVRSLASELETQRAALAERQRELEREAAARREREIRAEEVRKAEWTRKLDTLSREFRADADRLIARLDDAKERRAIERERARRERELKLKYAEEQVADRRLAEVPADWVPAEGEKVFVASLNKEGAVRSLRGRRVEVSLGQAVFSVPLEELRPLGAPAPARTAAPPAAPAAPAPAWRRAPEGVDARIAEREVPFELALLGMRVDEALAALDRYLDDALLAGYDEVRIVHGFGTGALKKAVREYLDQHPEVVSWRDADPKEGGGGATVARLEEGGA